MPRAFYIATDEIRRKRYRRKSCKRNNTVEIGILFNKKKLFSTQYIFIAKQIGLFDLSKKVIPNR